MEAGGAIIAPYLRRYGKTLIDKVVVSHEHSDHAGGLPGVWVHMPVRRLLLGQPLEGIAGADNGGSCHEIPPWRWDQVNFRFLTRTALERRSSSRRSGVLLLDAA